MSTFGGFYFAIHGFVMFFIKPFIKKSFNKELREEVGEKMILNAQ